MLAESDNSIFLLPGISLDRTLTQMACGAARKRLDKRNDQSLLPYQMTRSAAALLGGDDLNSSRNLLGMFPKLTLRFVVGRCVDMEVDR